VFLIYVLIKCIRVNAFKTNWKNFVKKKYFTPPPPPLPNKLGFGVGKQNPLKVEY
jgi:hypothetical protein